ncbi:thermonuclease family protein [Ketobacter sp.]|uniref:thermonuclease family protein n=1 Tax=Ketobacter sp. TaxID=2083498 RepID=UPI0025B7F5C7|nr:thermonuclease family protein [Ketobacter sp.]
METRQKTLKKAPMGAFFIACLFSMQAFALCALEPDLAVETVQVKDVFDGDTVRLVDGRKVRLVGINTPEVAHGGKPAEPLGDDARVQLQSMLKQQPIRLLVGKDSHDHYGRVLGHLFDGQGNSIIAGLLQQGAGFQVAIVPNLRYVDCYQAAQQQAREARLGVWGEPYYDPIAATSDDLKGGYARIKGQVESVSLSKKAIFVELEGQVSLKIERSAAPYIDEALLDRLVGLSRVTRPDAALWLEARGWLSDRLTWSGAAPEKVRKGQQKRYQMKITHQVAWQIL